MTSLWNLRCCLVETVFYYIYLNKMLGRQNFTDKEEKMRKAPAWKPYLKVKGIQQGTCNKIKDRITVQ